MGVGAEARGCEMRRTVEMQGFARIGVEQLAAAGRLMEFGKIKCRELYDLNCCPFIQRIHQWSAR